MRVFRANPYTVELYSLPLTIANCQSYPEAMRKIASRPWPGEKQFLIRYCGKKIWQGTPVAAQSYLDTEDF